MAIAQRKTVGAMVSSLARQALRSSLASGNTGSRNGVPVLPLRAGSRQLTPELIRQFLEELP
jgi:hypothetical protein